MKKSLFILLLSFLFIPSANAQSGEDEKSGQGRPTSYVSAGYHFLSRDYEFEPINRDGTRNESFDTERFPVGIYGEYGYNIYRQAYIFASVNYSYKSDQVTYGGSDFFIARIRDIIDLKAGIKYHWAPSSTPKISFYMATYAGIEMYKIAFPDIIAPEFYMENTLRNFVTSLGPGIYFKLHPSVWVDISAGYRKVLYNDEDEYTLKTNDLYGRIGIVYPLGYR